MALKNGSDLKTMNLVLTIEQAAALKRIKEERWTPVNRISVSDVAREVVEAGLKAVSVVSHSDFIASHQNAEVA